MRICLPVAVVLLSWGCTLFDKEEEPAPVVVPPYVPLTTTQEYPEGFVEGQFCAVRSIFEVGCVTGCHSAIVSEGNLDLQTDPYYSIVYRQSSQSPGSLLILPRNPDQSLLYQKMLDHQLPTQGGVMPPQGALDPFFLVPIQDWILAGAPFDCDPGPPPEETYVGDVPHHPVGWEDPAQHGHAANLQTDGDCRSCHGEQLDGGTAEVSCDSCHPPEWRTNCTYCHGGEQDETGAPPKDIDGQTNPDLISFTSHTTHIYGDDHYAYGCNQCHYKPTDVLTPGHVFADVTAGYGELDYTGGYAPISTYYQGTCSNVYCHGDGYQTLGTATDGDGPKACYDCHADVTTPQYWPQMSGRHDLHLAQVGAQCYECHQQVVDQNQTIIYPQYHVDGQAQVQPIGVVWNGATCTGACHDHDHDNENW